MAETDADGVLLFHRRVDALVYRFEPAPVRHGRQAWQREDKAVDLHWNGRSGWIVADAAGTVLSRPWDVERDEQGAVPPLGIWVSRKGDKSYVYHLVSSRDEGLNEGAA